LPVASASSLPNTVVAVAQNVPTDAPFDISSPTPVSEQETINKPQNVTMNLGSGSALATNMPVLSMFGGILSIDPAVVSQFKLEYLVKK
jgi:hypothetical protein